MFAEFDGARPTGGERPRKAGDNGEEHVTAGRVTGTWRSRILREPLTHFVLLGLLIFAIAHWLEARSKRYVINVGASEIARIANSYEQQYGSVPTADQIRTMVANYVREEIFLREGVALGLDKDDEIVRRRIAQKFDFLQQDMAVPRDPTDAELRDWYRRHRALYTIPARRSFDHIYFAIDQRGEAAARALAEQALARATKGDVPTGDAFPGQTVIRLLSQADTNRLFGGDGFAGHVFTVPAGRWAGPYRSGFGWHVVRVTESEAAQPRSFDAAKADARIDWKEASRLAQNGARYAKLLAQYRVTLGGAQP